TDELGAVLPFFQVHVLEEGVPMLSFTNTTVTTNLQFCVYSKGGAHKFVVQSGDKRDTVTVAAVKPGETLDLSFVLSDAASLAGTLRMLDGTPHVAVPVQALNSLNQTIATALTDDQGNYRIEKIKAGAYFLRAMVRDGYEYFVEPNQSDFVRAEAGGQVGGSADGQASVVRNEPSGPTAPPNPKSELINHKLVTVPPGETLEKLDFRFAPFKKGTWKMYDTASGLARNPTSALALEANGTVRVRVAGGAVSRFDGRRFTVIATKDDLLNPAIGSRFQAKDGSHFAHAGGRLIRLDGEKLTPLSEADGLPSPAVRGIASDTNGFLWVGTTRGLRLFDGQRFSLPKELELLKETAVNAVRRAKDGTMWITSATGAFHYSGDRLARLSTQDGLLQDQVGALDVSSAGVVWFSFGGRGITRYDGKTCVNFTTADGLPTQEVRQVLVGLDGTLWISSMRGLIHYDPDTFTTLTTRDGLSEARVNKIIRSRQGGLWFATGLFSPGSVFYFDHVRVIDLGAKLGLQTKRVQDLWEDSRGALWIATRDVGLWRWDNTNAVGVFTNESREVTSVLMEKEPTLWVGTGEGLWRLDGPDHFTQFTEKDGLPPASFVSYMARGRDGTLWMATVPFNNAFTTGDLVQYDGRKFVTQSRNYGIDDAAVGQISPCPDGTVWVATSKGIIRIKDGTVSRFTTAEGLANSDGMGVHATPDGHVYFATFGGVSHYDGVTWANLDKRDGLVDNTVVSVCPGDGGEIWFGGDGGVTRYRPNTVAPIARIIGVFTDQLRTNLSSLPPFTTGSRLSLLFDSIDLKTVPEKRLFRCRIMSGVKTAGEVGGTRESPEFRTWLAASKDTQYDWTPRKPGTYTFAVQAIDRDLNYSDPATLVLHIFAPWYANAWVLYPGGGTFAGLGLLAFVSMAKARRRKREARELRERLFGEEQKAREAAESAALALAAKNTQLEAAKKEADAANQAKSQ
ncbi:MAG: hypothetical protein HY735_14415, partial [Verrucomicrobia bacterium]|nr:hypothetical protein [Verrucomicrobiota bacterium]